MKQLTVVFNKCDNREAVANFLICLMMRCFCEYDGLKTQNRKMR
jgi:hypothetical protein